MAYDRRFGWLWATWKWGGRLFFLAVIITAFYFIITGQCLGCTLHVHFGERHYNEPPQRVETDPADGVIVEIDP